MHQSVFKELRETGAVNKPVSLWGLSMALRECPFCGKLVYDQLTQCSHCRETLPLQRVSRSSGSPAEGSDRIRRGLLFMLMAAVVAYFASGASIWSLPVPVPSILANYLLPLLFLSGLGLSLYGVYARHRSSH